MACLLSVSPRLNATNCDSQAAESSEFVFFYSIVVVIFSVIAVAAVVFTVKLVRLRHAFAIRSLFNGLCFYVAMFFPYAALQAGVVGQLAFLNSKGADALARASVQISSNAGFAVFFGLGFSGKVALVQLWMHTVRLHTNGSSNLPLRLQSTLLRTYKAFVIAIAVTVVLYVIGFSILTYNFTTSSNKCAEQQSRACVSSLNDSCGESLRFASILEYYEGFWAAAVLLVFTALAFLFNGVVFAM
jgi:hypothetical protein